jgi:CRP/FNR family transcriptional regulator, cyclic AMP receptor protein
MRATAELLQSTDLFSELPIEDCVRIAERSGTRRVEAGHQFTVQGVSDPDLQVIIEGSADVYVHDRHVRQLGRGDYFGEVSLLDNAPRSATIVAGPDGCSTVLVPQLEFWEIVDAHPHVVRPLLRGLATRLRESEDALWRERQEV